MIPEVLLPLMALACLFTPALVTFIGLLRAGTPFVRAAGKAVLVMAFAVIPLLAAVAIASVLPVDFSPGALLLLIPVATSGIFYWMHRRLNPLQPANASDDAVISAYADVLERTPTPAGCIADECALPYPKLRIKAALLKAIQVSTDEQYRGVLKESLLYLPDWQPGVGASYVGLNSFGGASTDVADRARELIREHEKAAPWIASAERERETLRKEIESL